MVAQRGAQRGYAVVCAGDKGAPSAGNGHWGRRAGRRWNAARWGKGAARASACCHFPSCCDTRPTHALESDTTSWLAVTCLTWARPVSSYNSHTTVTQHGHIESQTIAVTTVTQHSEYTWGEACELVVTSDCKLQSAPNTHGHVAEGSKRRAGVGKSQNPQK